MLLDIESTTENLLDVEPYNKLPNEFSEAPPGYVSAYRTILPESVMFVSKNGLRPEDNRMGSYWSPDREKFLEEIRPADKPISRLKCVYLYPDIPTEDTAVSLIDNGVLVEVLIDPEEAYIADAYWIAYVDMIERHRKGKDSSYIEVEPFELSEAEEYAGYYWKSAIPYTKWLKLSQEEKSRYSNPELLVGKDIPLKHMRRLN